MYKRISVNKIGMCLLLLSFLVVVGMFFAAPAVADEEAVNIKKIRPPAGFDAGEVDVPEAVRSNFDIVGKVDYKFEKRVVIGDRDFQIAEGAEISSVYEGTYVGARLNDRGEIVILERIQSPR